ncbi:hypothetical protein INR49_021630 [Caranx melampygus]|nr:hypothetical protein INR49_021630 [Caranx melampygus]
MCCDLTGSKWCKLGFFNLDPSNPQGCTPCFCFLHSSVCDSADGFSVHTISSAFHTGNCTCRQSPGSTPPQTVDC